MSEAAPRLNLMTAPDGLVDVNQPAAQVLAVVFFLIPGLNTTWVIERLAGRTPLNPSERLFRAVSWSVLVYACASPWLLRLGHRTHETNIWPWEAILAAIALLLVVPVALGVLVAQLRRSRMVRLGLRHLTRIHPAPTAWDFAFGLEGPFFVRGRLKSGEHVGGEFGDRSFATAYPEGRDVYLERAWVLDDQGEFVEPVEDSQGVLLAWEDLEFVELLGPADEGESADG